MRRIIITGAVLAACIAAVFGFGEYRKYATAKAMEAYAPPPVVVAAQKADNATWKHYIHDVGTVASLSSVDIKPEAAGTIIQVHAQSGESVKAGDVLFDIRHGVESAQLSGMNQDVSRAKHEYERYQALYKQGVISKNTLQKYEDTYVDTQSQLSSQVKLIDRKTVKAPFDGVLGINNVGLGQYVNTGQTLIRLTSLSPIYIDFSVRQQDVSRITQGLAVEAYVDAWPGESFTGYVSAVDPFLDMETRQVRVRAVFTNEQQKLIPGMFSEVRVELAETSNFVVVPETAVTMRMSGDTVWILEPVKEKDGGKAGSKDRLWTAKAVLVEAAMVRDGWVAITSGVKAGQMVVTAGQIKLYPGAQVSIDNSVVPTVSTPAK